MRTRKKKVFNSIVLPTCTDCSQRTSRKNTHIIMGVTAVDRKYKGNNNNFLYRRLFPMDSKEVYMGFPNDHLPSRPCSASSMVTASSTLVRTMFWVSVWKHFKGTGEGLNRTTKALAYESLPKFLAASPASSSSKLISSREEEEDFCLIHFGA